MGKRNARKKPTRRELERKDRAHMRVLETGDCDTCPYWSPRAPKWRRHIIKNGRGRCERPGGPCNPEHIRSL